MALDGDILLPIKYNETCHILYLIRCDTYYRYVIIIIIIIIIIEYIKSTWRFIMFSVIINFYNKKTKGPA
jgi:hypothetical protein